MAKEARVEITDNGGFILRTCDQYDGKGNIVSKGKIETATDMAQVSKFLEKNLSAKKAAKPK